jgi:hypothetical protein
MSEQDKEQLAISPNAVKSELLSSQSFDEAINNAVQSSAPIDQVKIDVANAAKQAVSAAGTRVDTALGKDPVLYRMIFGGLIGTALVCLGGVIWFQAQNQNAPQFITAIGGSAFGALTTLVSPSGKY